MKDVWVCGQCRSVNQARDQRCYACHTPRSVGAVDPLKLSVTSTAPVVTGPIGTYQSTIGLALLTSLLIVVAVGASMLESVLAINALQTLTGPGPAATDAEVEAVSTAFLLMLGAAGLALLAWATWLSRAVANLPALGVGYGRTSPAFVFVESLIPIYNMYQVHRIVADILRRIRPAPRDTWAILSAWMPLVFSIIVTYLTTRIALFFGGDTRIAAVVLGREIAVGLQVVAGLFLVALIWRVERRMRGRASEIRPDSRLTAPGTVWGPA
ncbi:MAG: DUF4328 domain-containing protein [Chloroflexi bacterium]|nr:MAG: DUF4328 domain-containing protein [Chloroflexota bacterium]